MKRWNSTRFTRLSLKKEPAYIVTCVDRASRCILGFGVVWERDWDYLQQVVDDAPPAHQYFSDQYFSDGFATYTQLMYPGTHAVAPGKSQTFSVEGDNAELRHYLARLGRRSRCFSRCLWALSRAVALFVYAWNRRQRAKRAFPKMPAEVCDFIADLI